MTDDRQILDHPAPFDIDASVEKIAAEFRAGFEKVAQIDRPAAALFGSARVKEGSAPYEDARAVGKLFGERGWAVVTGGGGGGTVDLRDLFEAGAELVGDLLHRRVDVEPIRVVEDLAVVGHRRSCGTCDATMPSTSIAAVAKYSA